MNKIKVFYRYVIENKLKTLIVIFNLYVGIILYLIYDNTKNISCSGYYQVKELDRNMKEANREILDKIYWLQSSVDNLDN